MPRVQVPNGFFKKERQQLYANWLSAFWRELTQNALDANSSEITIDIEQCHGYVRVRYGDNGPGMDRDILERVYFCLGETTKDDPRDFMRLGGFGRARILTCFSMRGYQIRTQNLLVQGVGADYTIEDTAETVEGCHLTIDIDDAPLLDMERSLRLFLRQSQIGAKVLINGTAWTEWAPRGSVVTTLKRDNVEFATVYSQDAGLLNHVIVRCRGMQSYFQISRVPLQVVIEIVPQMARTILTGNRDGMLVEYSQVLDQFLEDITLNTSVLTPQRLRQFEPEPAPNYFTAGWEHKLETTTDDIDVSNYVWLFDEVGDGQSLIAYRPATWSTSRHAMMSIWRLVCEEAVNAMVLASQTPVFHWAVGWYFGDPRIQAVTKRDFSADRIHIFCINPLTVSGAFWFATKDWKEHLRRLLALAAHEVTHGKHFSHDERFALLFTEIVAAIDYQRCLDAINNLFTKQDEKARAKALQRSLSHNHLTALRIMIELDSECPDGISHADVSKHWPYKVPEGTQDPVHGRISELGKVEKWGESLVEKVGQKVGAAGNPVGLYKVTEAGRRRFDQNKLVVLPELTEDEEELYLRTIAALKTSLNPSGSEFFRAVFRAGANGITIRELSTTDYALDVMEREEWTPNEFRHNMSSRMTHIRGFAIIEEKMEPRGVPAVRRKVLTAIARLNGASE